MRLNQRRRGDCYYNNNTEPLSPQGDSAFYPVTFWLLMSLYHYQSKEGRTRESPRVRPPLSNTHKFKR